ncbi:MAG: hypothetical protein H0Z33_03245 [Bacillaceae bacterium]|nr:hypothetical protein [Bacillaceae bacterium]
MIRNNLIVLLLQITIATFVFPLISILDTAIVFIVTTLGIFVCYIYIGTKLTTTERAFEDFLSVLSPAFIGYIVLFVALAERQGYHGSLGVISLDPIFLWYLYNPIGIAPGWIIDQIGQPLFEFLFYIVMTMLPTVLLWVGLLIKRNSMYKKGGRLDDRKTTV